MIARPEDQLRLERVVPSTPKGDVGYGCGTPQSVWLNVVELEEAALGASESGRAHEGTLALISLTGGALHGIGHVS
jgi:hypothetical protein